MIKHTCRDRKAQTTQSRQNRTHTMAVPDGVWPRQCRNTWPCTQGTVEGVANKYRVHNRARRGRGSGPRQCRTTQSIFVMVRVKVAPFRNETSFVPATSGRVRAHKHHSRWLNEPCVSRRLCATRTDRETPIGIARTGPSQTQRRSGSGAHDVRIGTMHDSMTSTNRSVRNRCPRVIWVGSARGSRARAGLGSGPRVVPAWLAI